MTDAERRIVEAARAWANGDSGDDRYAALLAAVAAYEQAQGSQPSPVSASAGGSTLGDAEAVASSPATAAGDQQYNKARYDALYEAMREERESLIFEIADRNAAQLAALRALVARKNAALHAAADALDAIADFYPGDPTTEAARDAARAAATEGGNAAD